MSLAIIQMEKNDGVKDFIKACNDEAEIYFCLMPGHQIIEDLSSVVEYFKQPLVGLLYYDYIEGYNYRYFSSFGQSIDFDRNIIISKKVLEIAREKWPSTFNQLIRNSLESGLVSLHIPVIMTKK